MTKDLAVAVKENLPPSVGVSKYDIIDLKAGAKN